MNESGGIKYEHHRSHLIWNIWSDRRREYRRMYREHSGYHYLENLPENEISVSYTHLTLPTTNEV